MRCFLRLIACFVFLFSILSAETTVEYQLKDLKLIADGLNIEGADTFIKYLRPGQIWANLCVILDRPFAEGVEWQEITDKNSYPLKETSIKSYNEPKVNLAYVLMLHYYLTNAHRLVNKSEQNEAVIIIQTHRNTSGPRQLELIENLLNECYPDMSKIKCCTDENCSYELFTYFFPDLNVRAIFYYGALAEFIGKDGKFNNADIVLSYSLVAGFNPNWPSGSLLIPNEWIPFSLKSMQLNETKRYFAENHLQTSLREVLKEQNDELIATVNEKFSSQNPLKIKQKTQRLVLEDFYPCRVIQADKIFNPSKLPSTFYYVK
ncbi:MAG: hypothetical protein HZB76_02875 [Chlamydiae bacterium]|nr:hypothetical protein [Chlamydiota bacterium]